MHDDCLDNFHFTGAPSGLSISFSLLQTSLYSITLHIMDLMIFSRKNVSFCANCRGVIMAELSKWVIPESMQDEYISNLTKMLSGLRDLMGINQSDIAKMIGVSRQTYSAIETGRRKMSWATYLSLVLLFVCDKATSTLFQNSEAFPVRIIEQINSDFSNNGFSFFFSYRKCKGYHKNDECLR